MIYQAAFANVIRRRDQVDFHKDDRPPLLVIGTTGHTIPASVSKEAAKRLGKSRRRRL